MKKYIQCAKELSRGVFWVIDDQLLAFPFSDDLLSGVSQSGNTYNHKKLWPFIKPKGDNNPYNYYPRGRVEIDNKNRAIIYLNPNISQDILPDIKIQFGILSDPIIRYDYSNHYKCYLDEDWKPD